MTENIFTPDEQKQFEELARRRGFASLRRYVQTLIQQDAEQHGESVDIEAGDELPDPVESFRAGWTQAMRGETLTEEEFWQAVSDDE
jgi:hypothetical protein